MAAIAVETTTTTTTTTTSKKQEQEHFPHRPVWQEDASSDACQSCHAQFSTFRRRHHCRGCGLLMCQECTSGSYMLLPASHGYTLPQRVCAGCRTLFQPFDMTLKMGEFGPREATGIVLVHPEMHSRQLFAALAPELARSYYVYAVDLPAHGSRVGEVLTLESAVGAVEEAAKEHGRAVIVAGMGALGGVVATRFADTHPQLACGLVLINSSVERFGKLEALKLRSTQAGYAAVPTKMQWNIIPERHKRLPPAAVAQCFLRSTVDYSLFAQCIPLLMEPSEHWLRDAIRAFDGPVLFLETDPAAGDRHVDSDDDDADDSAAAAGGGDDNGSPKAEQGAKASKSGGGGFKRWAKPITKRADRGGHVLINAARRPTLHILHGDEFCVVDPATRGEVAQVIDEFIQREVGGV